jgi:putative PIN family toxin of toxin-antitoxin system
VKKAPIVIFNASVVLAGLRAPKGGSGKVLSWVKERKIKGIVSEIILDEVIHHTTKIGWEEKQALKCLGGIFKKIFPPPQKENVEGFKNIVKDLGDAHVLASAKEAKANFLVTLDKKHLLVLKNKVRDFEIITPGQLIEKLVGKINN